MIENTVHQSDGPSTEWFFAAMRIATPQVFVARAIVILNVIIYGAMIFAGVHWMTPKTSDMLAWGANNWHWTTSGQWWRLVTSAFLHYGPLHLALNMWALYSAGMLAERLYGNFLFALIYLFSAVSGGLASIAFQHNAVSAGASGAVFGVYGALLAYLTMQRGSVPRYAIQPLWSSASSFVLYNIIFGLGHRGIDNAAHIGGLVGGAALGALAAMPLNIHRRRAQRWWRVALSIAVAAAVIAAAVAAMPRSGVQPAAEKRFSSAYRYFSGEENRLADQFNALLKQHQANKLKDADFADHVAKVILPGWESIVRNISAVTLPESSPSAKMLDLLKRYAECRRDGYESLAAGLRKGDEAAIKRYEQLNSEAEKLIPLIAAAARTASIE